MTPSIRVDIAERAVAGSAAGGGQARALGGSMDGHESSNEELRDLIAGFEPVDLSFVAEHEVEIRELTDDVQGDA
jgi:hypothetical protein